MRPLSLFAASLLLFALACPGSKADEKGKALLQQAQDAIEAIQPIVAEYTVTLHSGDGKLVYACECAKSEHRMELSTRLRESSRSSHFLLSNGQRFAGAYALGIQGQGPTEGRYLGTEAVEGVRYDVVEVTDWAPDLSHLPPALSHVSPHKTETEYGIKTIRGKWYIGPHRLIHHVTLDVALEPIDPKPPTPQGKPPALEHLTIEIAVTGLRKMANPDVPQGGQP